MTTTHEPPISHPAQPDSQAIYNLTDDCLKWASPQVPPEEVRDRLSKAGFRWFPRQKIWNAKWTPSREDLLIELSGEIDVDQLDDGAEDRTERFLQYAQGAAETSRQLHERIEQSLSCIPLGQPILVGHHSERRHRNHLKKVDHMIQTFLEASSKEAYWKGRAEAAERRSKERQKPGVIYRRVEELKADLRGHERKAQDLKAVFKRHPRADLTTPEWQTRQRSLEWHERWIEHLRLRIDFEWACYLQAGGVNPEDFVAVQAGDQLLWNGLWCEVLRTGQKNHSIKTPFGTCLKYPRENVTPETHRKRQVHPSAETQQVGGLDASREVACGAGHRG